MHREKRGGGGRGASEREREIERYRCEEGTEDATGPE